MDRHKIDGLMMSLREWRDMSKEQVERVPNRDVSMYVTTRRNFRTNNKTIYGCWSNENRDRNRSSMYTVYSYGPHFPMYIWDDDMRKWFGNSDKHSPTTSRHQNYARPKSSNITWVDTAWMKDIYAHGAFEALCRRAKLKE